MRLLKFNLPPAGESRVPLYEGSRLLAVGWQGRQLVAWVESPGEGPLRWHEITVAMTGYDVPDGTYLGTAQLDDEPTYVVHVYDRDTGPVDDPRGIETPA